MPEDRRFLWTLLQSRAAFIELVIAAIAIALSIEFLTDGLLEILGLQAGWTLAIGCVLAIASLLFLAWRLFAQRRKNVSLQGFFLYKNKDNSLVNVPRYCFASEITDYFSAAFSENAALKAAWDKEPIPSMIDFDKKAGTFTIKSTRSAELIQEATEYFVLSRLSTHLTDYFDNDEYEQSRLKEYGREDVPDILLKNRFMELFSRPMDQRPAFVDQAFESDNPDIIDSSNGKGGGLYEKFDLVLPADASVTRLDDRSIEINTSKLLVRFAPKFRGIMSFAPKEFTQYYIHVENFLDVHQCEVRIDLEVYFKLSALLTARGWQYHKWVDSFLSSLDEDFVKDRFFNRIGWEQALTLIETMFQEDSGTAQPDTSTARGRQVRICRFKN